MERTVWTRNNFTLAELHQAAYFQATYCGQLPAEIWASVWGQFRGSEALLCELNPHFQMHFDLTLGDLLSAVVDAVTNETHPKTTELVQRW